MSDTTRLIEIVCDGDRQPNLARKYMTVEDCEWVYDQKLARGGEQSQ
jgi:hypothetical protein